MAILHYRKSFRRRAHAVCWWLEVRSLIIALLLVCVIGVTVAVLLAAWLIGCEAGGADPATSQPAPSSRTVRDVPSELDPGGAGIPATPWSPAARTTARVAAPRMQIFHPSPAGKQTAPGSPPTTGTAECHLQSRLRSFLRFLPQSCPVSAPESHLSCVRGGYWGVAVCEISISAGDCP
jgi:hypothetical protein